MSLELSQEFDEMDNEFNEGDEGDDASGSDFEPTTRRAGRPRGTKKKLFTSLNDIRDPFVFAENYLINYPTEPIKMVIRRGGAILDIIDYTSDRSTIKIKDISQIQEVLGAGQYSFEIVSIKTNQLVRPPFVEAFLSRPNFQSIQKEQPSKTEQSQNFEDRIIQLLGTLQKSSVNTQEQAIQHQPHQVSLIDQLTRLAPLLPLAIEALKTLKGPEVKQPSMEEMMMKMRELAKQERDEFEAREKRIKEEIEERLEEERERRGIAPEKSLVEQVMDGLGSITKVVQANAKVKEMELKSRQPRPKALPNNTTQRVIKKTNAVEVMPKVNNTEDLELGIQTILVKSQEFGGDTDKLIEFIKTDKNTLQVLDKYDLDTVCKKTHEMLGLEEEVSMIREELEKIYANRKQ